MTKLLWITDPHLNFLRDASAVQIFGSYLNEEQEFDAVVITGDIAEAPSVKPLLESFARGINKNIYFVLGNHDYYRGSIATVHESIRSLTQTKLIWLDDAKSPILLDETTALVGQGGWYDGRLGNPIKSRVVMSDFELIKDFRPHFHYRQWVDYEDRGDLLSVLRGMSKKQADDANQKLHAAAKVRKDIIFATHYPPFEGACWHEGTLSDSDWMPWFTSFSMGEMLAEVALDFPENKFTVLCGHTHSPGTYEHLPNLRVLTGKSVYGAPDIAGVLELPMQWK